MATSDSKTLVRTILSPMSIVDGLSEKCAIGALMLQYDSPISHSVVTGLSAVCGLISDAKLVFFHPA